MAMVPVSFNYTVAPHLDEFNAPRSAFAASRPEFTDFVVGAFIFSRGDEKNSAVPRVLLLQRALSDSFGGFWDFPGGLSDKTDSTLLESVAREVYEETGFHVSRVVELVAVDSWVRVKSDCVRKVAKFSFIVEVEEAGSHVGRSSRDAGQADVVLRATVWEDSVKLAEDEHQAYVWATEEEVRESVKGGAGKYQFMGGQGQNVLKAFCKLRELA
ncbi:NUDIX domain protein [Thermoascus aurantiacus ATCC 26904]